MLRRHERRESGVSDIVGTVILIGVVVTFVGLAASQLAPAKAPEPPLRISMLATANSTANATTISLLHQGGDALDEGALKVQVTVDEVVQLEVTAGPSGTRWTVGNTLTLTRSPPLPPGAGTITLIHTTRGVLATGSLVTPTSAPSPPANFTIVALVNGTASTTVVAPGEVIGTANVTHPEGRKLVRYAFANLTSVNGPPWVALRDDGTRGDAVAGDGIWSGLLNVPLSSPPGDRTITLTAIDLRGASKTATAIIHVL